MKNKKLKTINSNHNCVLKYWQNKINIIFNSILKDFKSSSPNLYICHTFIRIILWQTKKRIKKQSHTFTNGLSSSFIWRKKAAKIPTKNWNETNLFVDILSSSPALHPSVRPSVNPSICWYVSHSQTLIQFSYLLNSKKKNRKELKINNCSITFLLWKYEKKDAWGPKRNF